MRQRTDEVPSMCCIISLWVLVLVPVSCTGYTWLEDMPATECVYEFMSTHQKNGTFASNRYPAPYEDNQLCRYIFQGQGRERVQIRFTDFDLNYPPGDPTEPFDCEDVDSVTVTAQISGEQSDIGVYCGTKRPPMLMSADSHLEVIFYSHSTSTAKGFSAIYQFVTDFGIKSGQQDPDMVCGFNFHSDRNPNGTFTSANFPGLYPRNTECHYLFYGKPDQKETIHITFPFFNVEGIPPKCLEDTKSDYVAFSNFNVNLPDRKMDRFCGTREHHSREVKSDGNFFRVTFKSNDVYDATGFEALYQFRKSVGG